MIFSFFLSGMGAAAYLIAGLFFLKFWRASQDRFFACLGAACWLFVLERLSGWIAYIILPTDTQTISMTRSWIYLFRLVAFLIILYAVIEKNREKE